VDELAEMLRWSFEYMQADDGEAVYLRLSTRPIAQLARSLSAVDRAAIIEGGYWLVPPTAGAELAIVASGTVALEAIAARDAIAEDIPGAGLLIVTSADRLQRGWQAGQRRGTDSHIDRLLGQLPASAGLVTVLDGHPATLSWLGAVKRHRVMTLGVDHFGQSGNLIDLYREYGLDADAILDAAARLCVHGN
jgi:pyruvate dehydrogenase E1 component